MTTVKLPVAVWRKPMWAEGRRDLRAHLEVEELTRDAVEPGLVGPGSSPDPRPGNPPTGRAGQAAGGTFGATVARRERTSTSGALGSWGWGIAVIAKSPITPGPNTRQWVEPPNWK